MVEQSGEPFLLSFLCYLPHTVQPLGHAFPTLCRVHVRLSGKVVARKRASNDADVSTTSPIIPYGGVFPLPLGCWPFWLCVFPPRPRSHRTPDAPHLTH